jgi:uncharacterized membrane protein
MALVSKKRHIAKTITWRVLASTDTLLIGWFLTGSWKIGTSIASIEILTKIILYYFHERIWYKTKFGLLTEKSYIKNKKNGGKKSKI